MATDHFAVAEELLEDLQALMDEKQDGHEVTEQERERRYRFADSVINLARVHNELAQTQVARDGIELAARAYRTGQRLVEPAS